jgi:DNA-binding CsgD family transcriptional regulator
MDSGRGAGDTTLADISGALANAPSDVEAILITATSSLSRIWPATWVAMAMNADPATSSVAAADHAHPEMADYVDMYVAALYTPRRAPTIGLSQKVIESGSRILYPRLPFDDLVGMLSPEGQAFCRSNPPPVKLRTVGVLIVPMRVGGATVGTLGMFDWHQASPSVLNEADLGWVQPVADRVALSLDHARLVSAARDQLDRTELIKAIALRSRYGQDLRLILTAIVEQVMARLKVDAADILLVTQPGGELVVSASAGFHSPSMPDYHLPGDADPPAPIRSRAHVDHLADLDRGGRNPRRSLFAREGFQTVLSVPIHAHNKLVGVLEIYNRSLVDWSQEWLDFFDMLVALAGVAIDYAMITAAPDPSRRSPGAPRPNLSELEMEILGLIAEGLTNRDIAERVHRSENTIKFHVRRILEKAGASNRTELVRTATREGWL